MDAESKIAKHNKKIIEDCCDCHCFDPETEEKTAIGMQLNDEFSIMHYEDSGKGVHVPRKRRNCA